MWGGREESVGAHGAQRLEHSLRSAEERRVNSVKAVEGAIRETVQARDVSSEAKMLAEDWERKAEQALIQLEGSRCSAPVWPD